MNKLSKMMLSVAAGLMLGFATVELAEAGPYQRKSYRPITTVRPSERVRVIERTRVINNTQVIHHTPQAAPSAGSGMMGNILGGAIGGMAGAAVYDAIDDTDKIQELQMQQLKEDQAKLEAKQQPVVMPTQVVTPQAQ